MFAERDLLGFMLATFPNEILGYIFIGCVVRFLDAIASRSFLQRMVFDKPGTHLRTLRFHLLSSPQDLLRTVCNNCLLLVSDVDVEFNLIGSMHTRLSEGKRQIVNEL